MSFSLTKFFDLERLFHLRPAIFDSTVYFLVTAFSVLILVAIVLKITKKQKKGDAFFRSLLDKYYSLSLTAAILGLMMTWFRYERVYILSARFWLLVWGIMVVVWLGFILKYQLKVIPEKRAELSKTKEFNKYLPKKK